MDGYELKQRCPCGLPCTPSAVYLMEDRSVLVNSYCFTCGKDVYTSYPIQEMVQHLAGQGQLEPAATVFTTSDLCLLTEMHISVQEVQ